MIMYPLIYLFIEFHYNKNNYPGQDAANLIWTYLKLNKCWQTWCKIPDNPKGILIWLLNILLLVTILRLVDTALYS